MTAKLATFTTALLLASAAAQADVVISTDPTQNMTCSGGVCSPTAPDAVLNVNDLTNMLATGDTKVTTGNGAVNINVLAALTWTSTSRLTLDAKQSILISQPVGVAGNGALTLTYNDGGSRGDLVFLPGGRADFANLSSDLVINGSTYRLYNDLPTMAHDVNKRRVTHVALANSYDASVDGTYKNSPMNKNFDGIFDGLGHAISNLAISENGKQDHVCVGLFNVNNGTIRDLSLTAVNVTAVTASLLGALVGCGATKISHVSIDGNIRVPPEDVHMPETGGVIGDLDSGGSISFVASAVNVINNNGFINAGGIAGETNGSISHSRATGTISGDCFNAAGGLVGISNALISYSSALGQVSANDCHNGSGEMGGLVGENYGPITQSFATGSVMGGDGAVGGLVGAAESSIDNSYAIGAVTGLPSARLGRMGGLAGSGEVITNSYSIGAVTIEGSPTKPYVGGFIGIAGRSLKQDYWDVDSAGTEFGCGKNKRCKPVRGLTDSQFKSGLPPGLDPKIWGQSPDINNGYPYLLANPPPK